MYKLLTDAIGLTSTYDTDYKCEYKQRHYSEYLQLTPPSDWQTCLQRNVTLKRERNKRESMGVGSQLAGV